MLLLPTAGAQTSAPAETGLVPAQMQLMPTEADLMPAETDLVTAEADQVSAEEQRVPAEADQVPAKTPLVSLRARPAETAHERTSSAVTEDPGSVLSYEQEADVTAVCAEATRPVESAEASGTSCDRKSTSAGRPTINCCTWMRRTRGACRQPARLAKPAEPPLAVHQKGDKAFSPSANS